MARLSPAPAEELWKRSSPGCLVTRSSVTCPREGALAGAVQTRVGAPGDGVCCWDATCTVDHIKSPFILHWTAPLPSCPRSLRPLGLF